MFSVNVLLYGDHPDLALRCLSSIQARFDPELVSDVRIGVNTVGNKTSEILVEFARTLPATVHVYQDSERRNVMKYPLMRKMLYDPERPIEADRVMWFDDDSFVRNRPGERWLWELSDVCRKEKPAVLGSLYKPGYRWTPQEADRIRRQPWYGGVDTADKPKFATGGWWVADLEFLAKWDYPIRQLKHNGGDVLLGEICRQQKAKLLDHKRLVAINADAHGVESGAKRRGVTTARPFAGDTDPFDFTHHDFGVVVTTFEPDGRLRNCA